VTREGLEEICFQPGRAADATEVFSLLTQLQEDGAEYSDLKRTPEREVVSEVAERLRRAGIEELQGMTVKDLVEQLPPRDAAQKVSSEN
jgi:hypothetical protein